MVFSKDENQKEKKNLGQKPVRGADAIKPKVSDYLAGEAGQVKTNLSPFLPHELIGGSVPYIAGTEEEAVWNAASQACGTEKVHFAFTIENKRCWYLACPSTSLASNPDSWCPLVAALPGNSEYWDRETVYIYEQEGMASALRWDPETGRMQVFLGAGRTLLPRIQSMDANFVTINIDMAQQVPWKNRALMSEKLSRAAARTLLLAGLLINFIILGFFVFQNISTAMVERNLAKVRADTDRASQQLMIQAYNAQQSNSIIHMVRIQELLDDLRKIDGTLVKYEADGSKGNWEALVPPAYTQGTGTIKGKVVPTKEPDGRVRIKGTR